MSQRQWNLIEDAVWRQEAGLGWAGLGDTNIKLKLLSLSEKMKKVFTGNN